MPYRAAARKCSLSPPVAQNSRCVTYQYALAMAVAVPALFASAERANLPRGGVNFNGIAYFACGDRTHRCRTNILYTTLPPTARMGLPRMHLFLTTAAGAGFGHPCQPAVCYLSDRAVQLCPACSMMIVSPTRRRLRSISAGVRSIQCDRRMHR